MGWVVEENDKRNLKYERKTKQVHGVNLREEEDWGGQ